MLRIPRMTMRSAVVAAAAVRLLSPAGCALFGDLGLPPNLGYLDPSEGVQGTKVTVYGVNLGSPAQDAQSTLHFGDVEIQFESEELIEWGPTQIVFRVPLSVDEGEFDVKVSNQNGESNALSFLVKRPPQKIFNKFIGAFLLENDDAVALLKMEKTQDVADPPGLVLTDWDSTATVTTVSVAEANLDTRMHDIRVDSAGNMLVSLSQLPLTGETEGIHGVAAFGEDYTVRQTDPALYETELRPRRLVSRALNNKENRQVAVLADGAAQVTLLGGDPFGRQGELTLLEMGVDAFPEAGTYLGSDLLVAGRGTLTPGGWLARIDTTERTVRRVTEVAGQLDDIIPVDLATDVQAPSADTTVTDIYIAYNPEDADNDDAGLLRIRAYIGSPFQAEATVTTSRIVLPDDVEISGMVKEHIPFDSNGDGEPEFVFRRLWLTWDELSAEADDQVLMVRIDDDFFPNPTSNNPDAVSTYVEWTAWQDALAEAATTPTQPEPLYPYSEIVTGVGGESAVLDPVGITILPTGAEGWPTFVLVVNSADDTVVPIRTDVPPKSGMVHGDAAFALPGTGATWAYCIQTESN